MNPAAPSRRDLFRIGAAGVLGLSLPEMMALQASAAPQRRARAKSVLVLLEQGGLSHMDTWDPKPDAVAEHRSPFKPIATSVPGIRFTELLPQTARRGRQARRGPLHAPSQGGANGHPNGTQYMLSGSHPASPLRHAGHWFRRGAHLLGIVVQVSAAVHHGSRQQRAGRR